MLDSQLDTKADIGRAEKELVLIKWMLALVGVAQLIPLLTNAPS